MLSLHRVYRLLQYRNMNYITGISSGCIVITAIYSFNAIEFVLEFTETGVTTLWVI